MFSHLTVPEFLRMGAYAAIGLLMIGYGLFVRRAATGTAFYTVFLFGGTVLLLFAVCVPLHVWEKLPKGIRIAFLVCLTIGLMLFLFVEALIIRHFGDKEEDVDYLIVRYFLSLYRGPMNHARALFENPFPSTKEAKS